MASTAKKILQFGPQVNGYSPVIFQWSSDSNYIAVATENRLLYLLDRRGKKIQETMLPNKGKVLMIDWDKQSEYVAVLQEDSSQVYLWAALTTNQLETIEDTPKTKATWLKWSHTHPILAFGTDKGGVIFYNKKNKKKVPTMGKHSKKVITGDWNNEGMLITGSQDKIITVSDYTSETKFQSFAVKSQPRNIRWTNPKTDDRDVKQRTIATVLNQKTLLFHEVGQTNKQPLQIALESKYGKITDFCLFGDGYIVLGFTEGYYAQISTHQKEMKDEVKSERIFNAPLEAMCTNNNIYKLAVAGQNKIKIINMADWKQSKGESIDLPKNCGKVNKIAWSDNGQTLIIATEKGQLYGYMTSSLSLTSCYNELIAVLNSFTDITILSTSSRNKGKVITSITLPSEPQSIHVGPCHLAMRVGSTVRYFQWLRERALVQGGQEVAERDYEFGIKKIMLNDAYVALLSENGKIVLHQIEGKQEKDRKFPIENDRTIIQFSLTKNFLIMLDNTSRLKFYHIEDQNIILEHRSDNPIVRIFPNKNGTKVVLLHQNGQLNLLTSATETLNVIKQVTDRVDNVIWDHENTNEFVIINGEKAYSYIVCKNNIFGHAVQPVNQILSIQKLQNEEGDHTLTKIEKNVLTLVAGCIYYMSSNGTINLLGLASHTFLENYKFENDSQEGHLRYFFQNLSLKRFSHALVAAKFLNIYNVYEGLGRKALENLDLDIALKAFQMGKNLSMVLTIQSFIHENERNLLIGNISMVLGKYDIAQEYYLKSTEPLNALDMRCDIQDWFIASSLAKSVAPHQESFIGKRLAIQTESQGNNSEALKLYERSVLRDDEKMVEKSVITAHNVQCFAGMARTSIKLGDIQRGFNIARQLRDTSLLIDIAVVCENMKQTLEAAQLYEKAGVFEKAAFLYLQLKMFKQAAPLMQKIKSPKLLIQFGKAKQSEGSFKEAEAAYEKAQSWQDVVRINLNNFENIEKPKNILRTKCTTTSVASMVASYCEKRGLRKEAVQFLIMANRKEEAFIIAQTHGQMDTYADSLKDCTAEQRTVIAQYYEGKSMWDKAAKQYQQAKNPMKALKLFQKAGQDYIPQMLDMVSKNKSQQNLIQQLLDYLMGETDEQPKDPIHTYRLYRMLGNYKNAAKIAVTIASQQQQNGGYQNAHDILFQTYQDIKKANTPIPLELEKKLLILHSYVLVVKRIIKLEEHQDAAFLLNRVAKNLSQFPTNAVNILTTAVIESMRSELKGLAYTWAVNLVKAQYREQIPKNYKDRIENLARRPVKQDNPQPKSPCPFCKEQISQFQMDCPKCLNNIPFCIASGKHVLADQLSFCTRCNFPCNYNYMKKLLECKGLESTCPMCNAEITMEDVKMVGENGVASLKVVAKEDDKDKDKDKQRKRDISTPMAAD